MTKYRETEIGRIPADWAVTTLGAIAKVLTDGSHFSPKAASHGRYMASVKDMRYSGFEFSSCKIISEDNYQKLVKAGCSPEQGDILISKDGANCLDIIFVYVQPEEIVLLSSIAILRLKDKYSPQFYRYFLLSPVSQRIMRDWFISGSAIPRVVLKDFKDVPVPEVLFSEQKAIAAVLSSLDDKIELLHRQNETLEKIAQIIFKEWFVEFNFPDKNGRPYKVSGGKMVNSDLGPIPEGWRVGTLGDESKVLIGRTPPRKEHQWFSTEPTDVKWMSVRDLGECQVFIDKTTEFLTRDAISRFNIPVIPGGTVVLSFKLTMGRVAITTSEMLSNEAIAQFQLYNDGSITPEFLYLFLKTFDYSSLGSTSSIATAVNSESIRGIQVVVPDQPAIERADNLLAPTFSKLRANVCQMKTLIELRDALLPKLMSGELRIVN